MKKIANIYAPVKRPRFQETAKTDTDGKEKIISLDFFICFVSFFLLLYSNKAGTWAVVGFLAPWAWVLSKKLFLLPNVLAKYWPLVLLPGLAIVSTLWSIEPNWTLRASLELAVTILVAILAGVYIKPRTLISALLCALVLIAIICMVHHNSLVGASEDAPVAGIFGSKNAFSAAMAIMMLTSIAVFIDNKQIALFRLIAFAGISLTPILLYLGRSMDAILSVFLSISIFLCVRFLSRFAPKTRLMIGAIVFTMALCLTILISFTEFSSSHVLQFLGKDSTLTGRTYLWNRALHFAGDRPFGGVGYQAFWRMDNSRAHELWYNSHVPAGSGLGFHNEYIAMLVDLGGIGLLILVSYIYILTKRSIKIVLGTMNDELNFAFLLFVYYLIRTPVETSLFSMFNIGTILFCLIWIYFKRGEQALVRQGTLKTWSNIYKPNKNEIAAL